MTDGRAARRHKPAKQATPPNQHRSGSEFEDPALCLLMPHSPEITNNVPAPLLSNLHLSAYSYPNTLPSQKQASISSNESLLHTGMQAPAMSMAPSNPMHSYNYSSAQQQRYNTAQPISTSCMSAGFNVPPNHYTAYSESLNHPPSNRNYESISASRLSPHTIPALLPPSSLPAASRSQSSISPIY